MSLPLLQGGKHRDPRLVAAFHEALQALRGLPILGSVTGAGTGTLVSLAIGAPVPRDRPIEAKVVYSSECDNTSGPMLTGLAPRATTVCLPPRQLNVGRGEGSSALRFDEASDAERSARQARHPFVASSYRGAGRAANLYLSLSAP